MSQLGPAASAPSSDGKRAEGSRIAVVVNGNAKSVSNEVIATLDQILGT